MSLHRKRSNGCAQTKCWTAYRSSCSAERADYLEDTHDSAHIMNVPRPITVQGLRHAVAQAFRQGDSREPAPSIRKTKGACDEHQNHPRGGEWREGERRGPWRRGAPPPGGL